ncbi:MAG: hypothetical protein RL591_906 [Planctomycetota bacterium]
MERTPQKKVPHDQIDSHIDPRIDQYIERAASFAQPILIELRARVHAACPEAKETIRWGMPAFFFHGPLANFAAFKAHCTFGFWKHELLLGTKVGSAGAMGSFGRITNIKELPSKRVFAALIKEAMRLNQEKIKAPCVARKPRPIPKLHTDFEKALARSANTRRNFEAMTPSHRREYVEWINDAKRDETRERRILQAIEQIAEKKSLHWKYAR